jgi:hypothetical protein
MKNIIILLLTSVFSFHGISQKPEKIYGNARQHKSISYYKEQKTAWKKVVDEHPKDANAWYNYYYVNRNLMFNDTTGELSPKEYHALLGKIVDEMEIQIPNSYEYNICKWQIGGFDQKALPYLKKAAEMGVGRVEHLDFMINQAELSRDLKERDLHSLKRFEAGQFSTGIIYYNYNVLTGLEKNTILITSGDNDTYPIWLLQAQGIRKDVTVINTSLIQLEYYREKIFAELGIEKWQKPSDNEMTNADHERYRNSIIEHISANKKQYPVSVALTTACDDKYTKKIQQNLYLTGLAYLFSKESIDNIAHLKKNMEQLYALDYLDKSFYHEISPDMVKIINGNYLIPLLTLYDHYKLSGDEQRKDWTKSKLMLISKGTENEMEVLKHLTKIK